MAQNGNHYADIPMPVTDAAVGKWTIRVACTGPVPATAETSFESMASAVL